MLKDMQETLEYAFDVLNAHYFGGELPKVVISIMSSPRTHGHFTLSCVWKADEKHLHEINVSAEHLDRPKENICSTLVHEMVHYYCLLNGIADVSQGGRYHNKFFKAEAEKRGLIISYAKNIGYSVTSPSPEFIEVIRKNRIEKPLDINRDGEKPADYGGVGGTNGTDGTGTNGGTAIKKPKCSTRKYICPKCGNSFRATKDINVMCMDCKEQFVKA